MFNNEYVPGLQIWSFIFSDIGHLYFFYKLRLDIIYHIRSKIILAVPLDIKKQKKKKNPENSFFSYFDILLERLQVK